jgi:antitoxin Phd
MMGTWQLQEAKAKLSEVIETARNNGPQIITQRGEKRAVVLSFDDWERNQQPKKRTLLEVLQSGPQGDLNIPPRGTWKMRKPVKF